jgi:hypothetical protein
VLARPLVFNSFSAAAADASERPYFSVHDFGKLSRQIEDKVTSPFWLFLLRGYKV